MADEQLKEFLEGVGFSFHPDDYPTMGEIFFLLRGTSAIDEEYFSQLKWGWDRGYIMIFWLS